MDWIPTKNRTPEFGEVVETMDSGGHVQKLLYERLWFFPDKSMYVYYVPAFWRPLDSQSA